MPSREAERFAERYAKERRQWREYRRNQIENAEPVDGGEVIRGINRALDGREKGQLPLRRFGV